MEFCLFAEPQLGATYDQQLRAAKLADGLGLAGFFRSDHFLATTSATANVGPTDAWVTLAGLARETSRIRLGTLMTSATFRHPGILAITVAEVDRMSGGRVELGIGTGWFEAEHTALGIPFPPFGERYTRLEEQVEAITMAWTSEGSFDYRGRYYRMEQNPGLPKPVQNPHPPVIIGGQGPKRTPRLAAKYAGELNMFAPTPEQFEERAEVARAACTETGRDPSSLKLSIVENLDRVSDGRSPADLMERYSSWASRGCARVYLQILDIEDLEPVRRFAEDVVPLLS